MAALTNGAMYEVCELTIKHKNRLMTETHFSLPFFGKLLSLLCCAMSFCEQTTEISIY